MILFNVFSEANSLSCNLSLNCSMNPLLVESYSVPSPARMCLYDIWLCAFLKRVSNWTPRCSFSLYNPFCCTIVLSETVPCPVI